MGIQIEDGKGKGTLAGVNSDGMLRVVAVSSSIEHHVNHAKGKAYMTTFETSASSSDNCIFYMKNTDDDAPLIIEGFWVYVSKACDIYMKLNDTGTPTNTTNLTPINLNTTSGISASCDCYKGTNIGGLSGGDEFFRVIFTAEDKSRYYNFDQDLIIGENDTFTIYLDTDATVRFNIPFNYHNGVII